MHKRDIVYIGETVGVMGVIPSLKLTFSPLKMDGWNTSLSYWEGLFSGAMLVFRECIVFFYIWHFGLRLHSRNDLL